MNSQRVAALVIGAIMLSSVAGFAVHGLRFTGHATSQGDQEQVSIPTIANRLYTSHEKAAILNSGRVIIESVYSQDCTECRQVDAELEFFASSMNGFVFLSSLETVSGEGFQTLQMIGAQGHIIPLDGEELTQEHLTEVFCSNALVTPRICVLKDIAQETTTLPLPPVNP